MRPKLAQRLRRATQQAHEAVDQAAALTGPVVTDAALVRMFSMLQPVFHAVEAGSPAMLPWGPRLPRAAWLRADLDRLATPVELEPFELAPTSGWWGWHYVLEGSTLGSAHLTRHLAEVRPDLPADHYFARNRDAATRWRGYLGALAEVPEVEHDAIVAAARHVFDALAARLSDVR